MLNSEFGATIQSRVAAGDVVNLCVAGQCAQDGTKSKGKAVFPTTEGRTMHTEQAIACLNVFSDLR